VGLKWVEGAPREHQFAPLTQHKELNFGNTPSRESQENRAGGGASLRPGVA